MTIVFETPGWLDMDAITTFGVNAKPNSRSPIGHFGTGLKYALAVLLREGCKVRIIVGNRRWDFDHEVQEFRGEEFDFCYVTTPGWLPFSRERQKLPFTTDLGKGWKMWQAFRELFSNTLDEGGECYMAVEDNWEPPREENRTFILVDGEAFDAEFTRRWETFLEDGRREVASGVQILPRASAYIYYRGVRVVELRKPSLYTYNILSGLELTEDRTAKYQFQADSYIRTAITESEDKRLIEMVLDAERGEWYEGSLNFDETNSYHVPSGLFMTIAAGSGNRSARKFVRRRENRAVHRERHYTEALAEALADEDWDLFLEVAQENADELHTLLVGMKAADTDPESEMITSYTSSEPAFNEARRELQKSCTEVAQENMTASVSVIEEDGDEIPF